MGFDVFESLRQTAPVDILRGISPYKTEPEVLRSINELISVQALTHQLVTQLVAAQGGKSAFIGTAQRANEAGAFDESASQVRLLSQRVDELERKLDEATKKAAGAAAGTRG